MDQLVRETKQLISAEYARASMNFGPINNSDHESYSIILEELQEALEEGHNCAVDLEEFWRLSKYKRGSDQDKLSSLDCLFTHALLAACEFIQVAAMAHKAELTIRERRNESC